MSGVESCDYVIQELDRQFYTFISRDFEKRLIKTGADQTLQKKKCVTGIS